MYLISLLCLALPALAAGIPQEVAPPADFVVEIKAAFGGGRVGGYHVFTLRRDSVGFEIARQISTRYEHLRAAPKRWAVEQIQVDSMYTDIAESEFFDLPNTIPGPAGLYDCWGWSLTVTANGQTHSVYVACEVQMPEVMVSVARTFHATGAEPLNLYGVEP